MLINSYYFSHQTAVVKYPIYNQTHIPFIHFTLAKPDIRINLPNIVILNWAHLIDVSLL